MPDSLDSGERKSKLDIDPKLASTLCYLFACVSGIIFLIIETENRQVRFHALQSLLTFGILAILSIGSAVLVIFTNFAVFQLANVVVYLGQFVLWLILVVRTYQGQTIVLPFTGKIAQENAGWP